jgi:hypothetical protein
VHPIWSAIWFVLFSGNASRAFHDRGRCFGAGRRGSTTSIVLNVPRHVWHSRWRRMIVDSETVAVRVDALVTVTVSGRRLRV